MTSGGTRVTNRSAAAAAAAQQQQQPHTGSRKIRELRDSSLPCQPQPICQACLAALGAAARQGAADSVMLTFESVTDMLLCWSRSITAGSQHSRRMGIKEYTGSHCRQALAAAAAAAAAAARLAGARGLTGQNTNDICYWHHQGNLALYAARQLQLH